MTLKQFARKLRKNQTDAERLLWRYLRNRQLAGCKFRRQYYIGNYIVDFICLEQRLIIELDGSQHFEMVKTDKIRTEVLENKSFKFVRFWNNEIFNNIGGVLNVINNYLITPHPNPLPSRGEGIDTYRR